MALGGGLAGRVHDLVRIAYDIYMMECRRVGWAFRVWVMDALSV